jgi:hypothetical protein
LGKGKIFKRKGKKNKTDNTQMVACRDTCVSTCFEKHSEEKERPKASSKVSSNMVWPLYVTTQKDIVCKDIPYWTYINPPTFIAHTINLGNLTKITEILQNFRIKGTFIRRKAWRGGKQDNS